MMLCSLPSHIRIFDLDLCTSPLLLYDTAVLASVFVDGLWEFQAVELSCFLYVFESVCAIKVVCRFAQASCSLTV